MHAQYQMQKLREYKLINGSPQRKVTPIGWDEYISSRFDKGRVEYEIA